MKLALIPRKTFQRDLDEIPEEVKENMEIKAVDTIEDVLKRSINLNKNESKKNSS